MELDDVRIFLRVADLSSFSRAAEQFGMPKSRASLRVKALEAALGCALLQRTTRAVRLTPDGEQFVGRARALCDEADEIATMFHASGSLRGRVRMDLPVAIARDVVIPRLPELLGSHPNLEVLVSTTDRRVDVVREGFDVVLRIGALADSSLVARRLGAFDMVNCVSPAYVRRFGMPRALNELDRHFIVHYSLTLESDAAFEFHDGSEYRMHPMRNVVTVNSTDAYASACLAGLGIIQTPRFAATPRIARGEYIEVLPELVAEPLPVSLVHAHGKRVPKRVRTVMTWLEQVVAPLLA